MSFSNYTAQAMLNALFGKTSNFGVLASAPTLYVALSDTDPTEDGSGMNEPSGDGYARVSTAAGDWNAATLADPSVVTNANALTFPTATADWLSAANLTHVGVFDAASGGNFLAGGSITTPKAAASGDTMRLAAGAINVSMD